MSGTGQSTSSFVARWPELFEGLSEGEVAATVRALSSMGEGGWEVGFEEVKALTDRPGTGPHLGHRGKLTTMAAGGNWSDYTYDPPFESTLVNLPGIRDAQALALVEKFAVALRVRDLRAGDIQYPAYGDVESIRNLHLVLYQDLYGHAGEFRTVEAAAQLRDRVAPVAEIRPVLEAACALANDPAWHRMDREDFAWRAAEIHALVEHARPFVVGNLVVAREFLADVASVGPYTLDVETMGWPSGPLAVSAVTRNPDGSYRAHPGPGLALAIHHSLTVDEDALDAARDRAENLGPTRDMLATLRPTVTTQAFADKPEFRSW